MQRFCILYAYRLQVYNSLVFQLATPVFDLLRSVFSKALLKNLCAVVTAFKPEICYNGLFQQLYKLALFLVPLSPLFQTLGSISYLDFLARVSDPVDFSMFNLFPIYFFPNLPCFLLGWCIFHTGISPPEKAGGFLAVCSKHLILILPALSFCVSRQLHLC
jgi:hypothetical protein